MKEERKTVYICDNCDAKYTKVSECLICEQADLIISALIGTDDRFMFLDETDEDKKDPKKESINKDILIDRLRPAFERLWGKNGTHVETGKG